MRNLIVVIENPRTREVFGEECTRGAIGQRFAEWLDAAFLAVGERGACKSFKVGVHVADANCDHETLLEGAPHG